MLYGFSCMCSKNPRLRTLFLKSKNNFSTLEQVRQVKIQAPLWRYRCLLDYANH